MGAVPFLLAVTAAGPAERNAIAGVPYWGIGFAAAHVTLRSRHSHAHGLAKPVT
jgi:hypothetical protein